MNNFLKHLIASILCVLLFAIPIFVFSFLIWYPKIVGIIFVSLLGLVVFSGLGFMIYVLYNIIIEIIEERFG
jgi:uncharacterized membrane protein YkgB